MLTPIKWGSEFLVNSTILNNQIDPAIAGLADGRFVVTWSDFSQTGGDTSGGAIRAQIFNADGSMSGSEFLANTTTTNNQIASSITPLADGRFVVTWEDKSQTGGDTSSWAVRAQIFNANGSKSGGEFLANTSTIDDQDFAVITTLADGRFVVAWMDGSALVGDTSGTAIRAQIFNTDGTKSDNELLVNTTTTDDQAEPAITALVDGRFVVTWDDLSKTGGDMSFDAVRAQIFNADGSKSGGEFLVNTTTNKFQNESAITALANGRFVVTWTDDSETGGDTTFDAIRGQIFNADGSKSGGEFLVNTTTISQQLSPSMTTLADGRFAVAWVDLSQTGGDNVLHAIRAQVFNADGSKSGSEFLVNTTTDNVQDHPTITELVDGRIVISWQDNSETGGDTSVRAVRAQIFDPRLVARDIDGTAGDDDFVGTQFNDTIEGAGGDDTIDGGAGNDTASYASAGSGVTQYLQFTGRDTGGAGRDTLTNIEDLTGSAFNDRLIGDANDNVLTGGDGVDILKGKGGNDTFHGGDGDDKMVGGDGDDTMFGGDGNDTLIALAGLDILNGGKGNDGLFGGRDSDTLNGNFGSDNIRGNLGNDIINGGANGDTLRGGGQNDTLNGDGGNDFLFGENHLDTLFGGAGDDSLTGGVGGGAFDGFTDTFIYKDTGDGGGGFDRIKDFENGIDVMDLQSFGFANFAAVQALTSDSGVNMRINFGDGDVLLVENFQLADFDVGDVLL